jgi:ubiquinone biosynthesis protein COQ9
MPPRLPPRTFKISIKPIRSRLYHSHDHPPPPGPFNETESLILSASAPYIPTHGFTHTTLALGAKDAGYIDASTNLFPKGAFSLVWWHLYSQRIGLKDVRDGLGWEQERDGKKEMGVGQKVKALTWERLMGNREVVGRWQEVGSLPSLLHFST